MGQVRPDHPSWESNASHGVDHHKWCGGTDTQLAVGLTQRFCKHAYCTQYLCDKEAVVKLAPLRQHTKQLQFCNKRQMLFEAKQLQHCNMRHMLSMCCCCFRLNQGGTMSMSAMLVLGATGCCWCWRSQVSNACGDCPRGGGVLTEYNFKQLDGL
jgi:hypothetical protein